MKTFSSRFLLGLVCGPILTAAFSSFAQSPQPSSTAWSDGGFHVETAGVIGRSDIVLEQPNDRPDQAMPLGNGRLGVAVWAADGLTAQLNRVDTMPDRAPLARLTFPGLAGLVQAQDYSGRLDLYDGEFREHGGGMTATVYVERASDTLVIDVSGASPGKRETAQISLSPPRAPLAAANASTGILSETWADDKQPGASGRTFGSLAAITANAQNVSALVTDARTVTLSFEPNADGHFRILVAGPHYDGKSGTPFALAHECFRQTAVNAHRAWWHKFWGHTGAMKITSADGSGEYMESLRALYLFSAAAESGGEYPGSQAGVADLFSSVLVHRWDPAAYWHWNLRMQVAANLSAGAPELNAPYFNLYRENLANMEQWTRAHMEGRPGICVPETMRFNGQGIEYETWDNASSSGELDCDAASHPYYNARTISTGAEVSLWIWQQYLATGDRAFLAKNYPVMAAAARFLLSYEKPGNDGLLHTSPSNAHETQWDTTDPTTDLAARTALFTAAIHATQLLKKDEALAVEMRAALARVPAFPRTESSEARTLLSPAADAEGRDVIAPSYLPGATNRNVENIGLEPVWPYDLIGDTSPLFALATRTYAHRPYPAKEDWSFDPIQAARLQLPNEVRSTLIKLTETYQLFVNGFADWGGKTGEFYVEQEGVAAAALQEALVQDYDGILRIDPAFPADWDVDGSVYVRGNTRVDVQISRGVVQTLVIEAGMTGSMRLRNPWRGCIVEILAGGTRPVVKSGGPLLSFLAVAGQRYVIQSSDRPVTKMPYAEVSGTVATSPRKLGPVQIGMFARDK